MSVPRSETLRRVVSIGVFDGLHLGHRAILERARARADAAGCEVVVVSFDPHPDVVLARDAFRLAAPLTPIGEKRRRLAELGIARLDLIAFTRELAALEPEVFVERHLVVPHAPRAIVVGAGFALGRARSGDVPRLQAIGAAHDFEVEAVPLVAIGGAAVSSTRIRALLAEGRVAELPALLGRTYALEGRVVGGDAIGRTIGWPTANLRLHEEKLLPRDGIYAARVGIGDEPVTRPAAVSVGVRPTFDGKSRTIEAHLIDFEGELPGREMRLAFVDWLRPELKFESPVALAGAIQADVEECRARLARAPQAGV
ncbi:MAG: riboflavin biosynthesis protein RibF [Candidatus Eisenbacteria bacterium]|uniref:Riboflavin biosynthesis protein n=1 Tax=Eiseniibacteriota bacterium TaxID=2212470 RepID=A0A849SFT7_UNCEI|nr:riboflavin biosynthesis protein RibF [Candidatus Eisenbacteria bacterium]